MASGSVPTIFGGTPCPENMSYGFVHGTSPGVGHITMPGVVSVVPGSQQSINLGASCFTGYVTNYEYDGIENQSTIRMVDWRDRLHDIYLRAALNMQEDDGRLYHILPEHWEKQRRTYVTRPMGQLDFFTAQAFPPNGVFQLNVAKNNIFSAYSILHWIASTLGFVVTAEALALKRLKESYPLGLDFNAGSTKVIDAIQQIIQKSGCQFACFGTKHMHVTVRGYTENAFAAALIAGQANICGIGVSSGKLGQELNEQGRRVRVIGDRNKYEFAYVCRANWNPAWTWGLVFNGIEMGALLEKHGLTRDSKVSELPARFHDLETWSEEDNAGQGALPARKTRNMMTIRDYLEKVVYRAYVVDARTITQPYLTFLEDKFTGTTRFLDRETLIHNADPAGASTLKDYPRSTGYDDEECNFLYPISKTLVTDSNLQFLVYNTSRKIVRGAEYPFGVQMSLVPKSQGAAMEVEEVINSDTGQAEFRVRFFFNEPQFWLVPDKPFDDPRSVEPDLVVVRLCVDGKFFQRQFGEGANNIRVREQVISVRNLYEAFYDGQPASSLLRDNFRRDIEKRNGGGAFQGVQIVTPEQIAQRVATQALAHLPITKSGAYVFEDICGAVPDGIIDSVSVTYDFADGATESVNLTDAILDDRGVDNPAPFRISRKFHNEGEILKERLLAISKAATLDKRVAARSMALADFMLHEPGALVGVPVGALSAVKGGIATVDYSKDIVDAITDDVAWVGGTVVVTDKSAEPPTPDPVPEPEA